MRSWGLAAVACAGCSFTKLPAELAGPGDEPDAAPADTSFPLACLSMPQYLGRAGTAHRYRLIADLLDHDAAVDACAAEGAHPVAIDDDPENVYVHSLAVADTWIGYDDLATEGTFRWIDGAGSGYTAWAAGQPDDSPIEDCVEIRADGQWNDRDCAVQHPVICECDPQFQPPPTPACRTTGIPATVHGRRYFLHEIPAGWNAAATDCTSTGASLVSISDPDEDALVDALFAQPAWIGLSDQQSEGTFGWVNQAPFGFTHWAPNAPTAPGAETRDCVLVQIGGGEWADVPCGESHPYLCECDPAPR